MARLVCVTPDAEKLIAYMARVSSDNQDNPDIAGLITYCVKHQHWSILEMANMVVEVTTSRAIAAQILRHRSFTFQEFSQRYAKAQTMLTFPARRQDTKDRQNSIDDMSDEDKEWFQEVQKRTHDLASLLYERALERGIAKEQARFLLPLSTETTIYMNGTARSWVHYLQLRTQESTQLEHRQVANAVKGLFIEQFPIVSEALGWR